MQEAVLCWPLNFFSSSALLAGRPGQCRKIVQSSARTPQRIGRREAADLNCYITDIARLEDHFAISRLVKAGSLAARQLQTQACKVVCLETSAQHLQSAFADTRQQTASCPDTCPPARGSIAQGDALNSKRGTARSRNAASICSNFNKSQYFNAMF